jgi:hypothetical protein
MIVTNPNLHRHNDQVEQSGSAARYMIGCNKSMLHRLAWTLSTDVVMHHTIQQADPGYAHIQEHMGSICTVHAIT